MKNIMLDIETLGNTNNATILSIAACRFNPMTGEIGETFHLHVDATHPSSESLSCNPSTVLWWLGQSQEAREAILYGQEHGEPLDEVLCAFARFVQPQDRVWGNGITFDCGIVKNAYEVCGIQTPWKFWNERDVRTVVEMGLTLRGIDPKTTMEFEGIRHDALSDAIHQAKYVSEIYKSLQTEELV